MRIIHLSDYGGPYPGSFIPMLRAVNDAATERDWSFEAIFTPIAATHPWYAELEADGILARTAPDVSQQALSTWTRNLVFEQTQTTVLHTHFTKFAIPAVLASRGRDDTVVIWHEHCDFSLQSGLKANLRSTVKFGILGRRVDAILCVSSDLRDAVHRRLAPARRLYAFPNAIDLKCFRPATLKERNEARAQFGIPVERPLLLHFGWDWKRKRGDLFLESIAILTREGVDVTAMCVGGGESAQATSTRLSIEDRVLVVPAREDVRTLYAAADVFVSSSRAEGAMPLAALESLATGTPVVASAIANHVLLAERTHGCVVAQQTPRSFAVALRSVLNDRAEGRLTVDITDLAESLDLKAWAMRLLDLYAERLRARSA